MFAPLLATTLLASTALGHFTLDYPTTRGFDDAMETQFCGGFNTSSTRQAFPLHGGSVWIGSHHPTATVFTFISTSENPTSNTDFNATANGTPIPELTNAIQLSSSGEKCYSVDIGALEGLGLTNGSLVTLLIEYRGGDGSLYQCSDLVLVDNYTVAENWTCTADLAKTNDTAAPSGSSTSSGAPASTSSAAPATSSKSSASHTASFGVAGVLALAAVAAAL